MKIHANHERSNGTKTTYPIHGIDFQVAQLVRGPFEIVVEPQGLYHRHVLAQVGIALDVGHARPQVPRAHALTVQDDRAHHWTPQAGHQVQQGGALFLGGGHDGHDLAAPDLEGDLVEQQVPAGGEAGGGGGPHSHSADLGRLNCKV